MSGLDRSAVRRSNRRSTSSSLSIIGLGRGCAPLSGPRQGRTGSRNSVDFWAGHERRAPRCRQCGPLPPIRSTRRCLPRRETAARRSCRTALRRRRRRSSAAALASAASSSLPPLAWSPGEGASTPFLRRSPWGGLSGQPEGGPARPSSGGMISTLRRRSARRLHCSANSWPGKRTTSRSPTSTTRAASSWPTAAGWTRPSRSSRRRSTSIPDSAHAHDNLATVYAEKKLFREALGEYLTALKLEPDSATAHYNLACFLSTHATEMAVAEYKRGHRAGPGVPGRAPEPRASPTRTTAGSRRPCGAADRHRAGSRRTPSPATSWPRC